MYVLKCCYYCLGLKFWKVGSRKLYAVKESDLKESRKRLSANVISIPSSDSEEELPTPITRRKRTAEAAKLSIMSDDIREMKDTMSKVFRLTSSMSVPLGLRNLLYDTFKCSICQATPMTPPVIFAKCCKNILGCQQCVDTWYRGEQGQSRTCPRCRSDRAYVETCKVNGLDDFLTGIAPLLEGANPEDDDEGDRDRDLID